MPADLLPPWPLFAAFLVASLALAVSPGPGVLYIVARTLAQGRRNGLVSVAGVALGNLGNALAAALGLAALLAISSLAFSILKYAGALYLVYLGVQMLRATPAAPTVVRRTSGGAGRIFRDGFVVALLNPKTTIFYAAFLPQFVTPGPWSMHQTMLLGTIFVVIAAITDMIYVLAAGAIAPRLAAAGRLRRHARIGAASTFIGLGVYTALAKSSMER
jgi:threonine/homoserine/homoserine lactone efflux protein